jgi:hypothetical protein
MTNPITRCVNTIIAVVPRFNVRRWMCGIGFGHTLIQKYEGKRIYLKCETCPYETPGWFLPESSPRYLSTESKKQ